MAPPMKPSREEMLAVTMNQKLAKQGAKTRKLAESRDVNTMPDPKTYAAVMGLLGERPDEMGFSVAHPKYKEIMDVADPAFALGTAAQVVPLVKPAGQAVRGAAKALAPKAGQMVMDAAQATGMPVYGLGVVKPKGGNWLAETDDRIKRMTPYPDLSKSIAVSKARIASAENAGASPRSLEMMKGDLAALERDQAVNNWTTRNLGNYIKKEMGTPDDPVRKLAEEGIVHAPHGDYIDVDSGTALPAKRSGLGFPAEGMGKSPEAKAWEELSDFAIKDTQAKNIQGADEGHRMYEAARARADAVHADIDQKFDEMVKSSMSPEEAAKMMRLPFKNKAQTLGREGEYEAALGEATKMFQSANAGKVDVLEANPWVSKLDPEERLYSGYFGDLGFDHIIDVLREDVRAGRIRPEQLSKVSMDQAVRRTYEYDIEMAKKMAEAQIKATEGMPIHKEYPEGYKWIELAPPKELPSGYSVVKDDMTGGFKVVDANGKEAVNRSANNLGHINIPFHKTEEEAIAEALKYDKRLEEALKYEGDVMGHCVGGYCPDVLEGRSRIFSLRDPKGEPHVTVEVEPESRIGFREGEGPKTPQERFDLQTEWLNGVQSGKIGGDVTFAEWWRSQNGIPEPQRPLRISQIKGKQNKAPIEDYLPYVQDFVRSGNWSKVGDFHNTGLIRKSDLIDKFTPDQLDAIGKGEYLTKGEYDDLILKALRPPEEGMKAGGEVKMKEGGIKETPVKNKAAHGMSKALGAVHKFASEPFGYKNPPGEIVSEMLGIPATARTLERMGYGEPLTTGKGMTAKPRADTMDALMAVAPLAPITKGMPVGAVIKPKGGNWLTGSVEKALDPMIAKGMINNREIPYGPDFDIAIRKRIEDLRQQASQPGYQGGAGRAVEHLERELQNPRTNEAALNNWISRNLTNYVKKEMATPEDPVRKLAEQGIVHKQFHEIADPNSVLMQKRMGVGMPAKPMAQTEAGQFWENLADRAVDAYPAGSYKHGALDETLLERNPWLAKTPDETMIYSGKGLSRDLGFGHVVDVLREDLATGRIRPEQLNKVSMEQAVRRTYEYDQELAKKMEQARAAAREGLPVHKEYPEGFRWVELNKPGAFATESEAMGHSVRGYEPPKGHADWTEGSGDAGSLGYGHGGWEAIKSGKAKVYSLVDPKGNPHVTVEVGKGGKNVSPSDFYHSNDVPQSLLDKITEGEKSGMFDDIGAFDDFIKASPEYQEYLQSGPPRITQIKGKQNAAPKPEYLPYVQDFVRGGQWSDVGDLKNTGLRDMNRYEPLRKYLEGKGTKFERYIPEEEFNQYQDDYLMDRLYPPDDPRYPPLSDGMKAGGEVKMGIGGVLALGKGAQKAEKGAQVIKASEAFGAHEGLPVYITQSDRTKVGQGFLGGPGFSGLQHTSEPHREARAAWGVKTPGVANTIVGDPAMGKNPLFTTMIGSPTQHQSNQMVFDKMYRQFKNEAKKGNLSDELRFMINDKLAKAVDKDGKNVFPPNVDILSKDFHKMADTFDRRSIAGHLMGGVGIGGKKGQIIDYDKIIKGTTDPGLIDAPSGAIGNRIFTLDKNIINRPDLHPAFPTIMTGEDMNVMYNPVPRELFMQDFINQVRNEKGRNPGYLDYIRGRPPSQFISEDWLTKLQKEGHKKGGLLKVKRKK